MAMRASAPEGTLCDCDHVVLAAECQAQGPGVAESATEPPARDRKMGELAEGDAAPRKRSSHGARMLLQVANATGHEKGAKPRARPRCTAEVGYGCRRDEANVPARLSNAPTEIDVFAVQEETFVQAAQLLEKR